jgi:uncharacterized membrane protein YqaE (UPF0057 family)
MRMFIPLILPWLTFFAIARPIAGLFCLILQITLIGWVPAAIWAIYASSGQYEPNEVFDRVSHSATILSSQD